MQTTYEKLTSIFESDLAVRRGARIEANGGNGAAAGADGGPAQRVSLVHRQVRIHGLVSKPSVNGLAGVAEILDEESGRYVVVTCTGHSEFRETVAQRCLSGQVD